MVLKKYNNKLDKIKFFFKKHQIDIWLNRVQKRKWRKDKWSRIYLLEFKSVILQVRKKKKKVKNLNFGLINRRARYLKRWVKNVREDSYNYKRDQDYIFDVLKLMQKKKFEHFRLVYENNEPKSLVFVKSLNKKLKYKIITNYFHFTKRLVKFDSKLSIIKTNRRRKFNLYLKRFAPTELWNLANAAYYQSGTKLPKIRFKDRIIKKKNLKWDFNFFKQLVILHYSFRDESNFNNWKKKNYKNFIKKKFPLYVLLDCSLFIILFKLNLLLTSRHVYSLIKIGGVKINNNIVKNRFSILKIGDIISFRSYALKKTIFKFFRYRIKKKKILFCIPEYVECNFRLMIFTLWQFPIQDENLKTMLGFKFFDNRFIL